MNKIFAAALAISAIMFAMPASAQLFDGPYVGAEAGWNHDKVGSVGSEVGDLAIHNSKDSYVGGAFVGYNYPLTQNIVVGVEGGFSLGANDDVRNGSAIIDPNYSFDVGARAGYLINPRTLLYVRGGYENMRAFVRNGSADGLVRGHDSFDGWSVGGGVERGITDKVSARVEYRYSDLGSGSESFDRHQALVGVAYHF